MVLPQGQWPARGSVSCADDQALPKVTDSPEQTASRGDVAGGCVLPVMDALQKEGCYRGDRGQHPEAGTSGRNTV